MVTSCPRDPYLDKTSLVSVKYTYAVMDSTEINAMIMNKKREYFLFTNITSFFVRFLFKIVCLLKERNIHESAS